jgi:hypothetical protein
VKQEVRVETSAEAEIAPRLGSLFICIHPLIDSLCAGSRREYLQYVGGLVLPPVGCRELRQRRSASDSRSGVRTVRGSSGQDTRHANVAFSAGLS